MNVCGGRFQGEEVTDWILSTSASCLDGSTTASQILQELFKRRCSGEGDKNIKKKQKATLVKPPSDDRQRSHKNTREKNETLIVKKIAGKQSFENFDEGQHLNGCPVKWFYNKKLLEKNKRYKIDRTCHKKLAKKEEVKKEKCKNLRDKTPKEVKIHKINLVEKYSANYDERNTTHQFGKKIDNEDQLERETQRRKLAAKLNWKLYDESSLPALELKHNYLPPRPMLGLKPFLSLFLAENQMTNCRSLTALAKNSAKEEKMTSTLRIQSLDLPVFLPPQNSQPRNANCSRWGSKSWRLAKKLQIPSQITINLEKNQTDGFKPMLESKISGSNAMFKKSYDKPRQTKSLSALFYELKDKSNFRNQPEENSENIAKELTLESFHSDEKTNETWRPRKGSTLSAVRFGSLKNAPRVGRRSRQEMNLKFEKMERARKHWKK